MARLAAALVPRQTQRLSRGQQQALALLQLPAAALAAAVETALADNPLLVRGDTDHASRPTPLRRRGHAIGRGGLPALSSVATTSLGDGLGETVADPGPTGLHAHLIGQLRLEIADPVDRTIGLHLIDLVSETGYLDGDGTGIAALLGVAPARVEAVLARLRAFEPAGVFARDLADCLALQLEPAERNDPAMRTLLANLRLLAAGDRGRLAALCGVDAALLDAMVRQIRTLDPKPGLRFGAEPTVWTVPDAIVERDRESPTGYRIRLNDGMVPDCRLDDATYRRLMDMTPDRGNRSGLRTQYQNARNLLTALQWRGTTLLAIAHAIVVHQRGFFDSGMEAMRPLTRRHIAGELGLDESTIGRAVAGKTMETPRGLLGFDFFFQRGLPGDRSGAVSAARVRARLAALLAAETEPLDDAALAGLLAADGLPVARRTVAKYRESLRIPTAGRRRRRAARGRGGRNPVPD